MVSLLCDGSITTHAQHLGHCYAGLETYANYMFGGGYIVSADVAKALVTLESLVKLKFTPIEDATVGFWLMGMDIRQIDHPKCVLAPSVIALQMGGAEVYAKAAFSGVVCAVKSLTGDPYRHCEPSLRPGNGWLQLLKWEQHHPFLALQMPERQQNVSLTACCCRMNTNFWACCFKAPERIHGKQIVSGFQLDEDTEADICSGAYCPA